MAESAATFPGDRTSASQARRFVDGALEAWKRSEFAERARLLVSELVTNAVLHAGTPLDVVVRLRTDRLRVEVRDGSSRLPERKHYAVSASTGRGLLLVEALATAWGTEEAGDGKVVWFELDAAELAEQAGVDLALEEADVSGPPPEANPRGQTGRPEASRLGSAVAVLDG